MENNEKNQECCCNSTAPEQKKKKSGLRIAGKIFKGFVTTIGTGTVIFLADKYLFKGKGLEAATKLVSGAVSGKKKNPEESSQENPVSEEPAVVITTLEVKDERPRKEYREDYNAGNKPWQNNQNRNDKKYNN